jgi:hypothetical protein
MISILLIGIWFGRVEKPQGFRTYSFIIVGAVIVSTVFFVANVGSPIFGLTERIPILVGFQWTFTLALQLLSRQRDSS